MRGKDFLTPKLRNLECQLEKEEEKNVGFHGESRQSFDYDNQTQSHPPPASLVRMNQRGVEYALMWVQPHHHNVQRCK